ncbi:MAG: alpha-glucosidase [Lactobacillus sp.]|jgi:glucan 1,6-alpha-glucosidase|nr:alpha-glucosidase [Lactobacillus sp.]
MAESPWWQTAVIYQIYPRSFADSNGDGIGDIQGIIAHLDYLVTLGVSALWICPMYASPNHDNGYDISDYQAIAPEYGTMADFDELVTAAKRRGLRIIMDLVLNHTSDEHPWFVAARNSIDDPHRDFYVWRRGHDKQPPNVLQSVFSDSAWQFDSKTSEYYLHLFTRYQPDLNWQEPRLRAELYKMMNFWVDKGVGGFRLDVIDLVGKEPDQMITAEGPCLHSYLQELNSEVLATNSDLVTVGEAWSATPESGIKYSAPQRHELSMVFQFEHMMIDQELPTDSSGKWESIPFSVQRLKQALSKWQIALADKGWNSLFWNNHDLPRIVSRWGDDQRYWQESAKAFAILLYFMQGTPYLYQGEEIGMTNSLVSNIDQVDDVEARNMYFSRLKEGASPESLIAKINRKGRDSARTPMQWNAKAVNAGFSSGKPWLPVNQNYHKINVEAQLQDQDSILTLYRQLITFRKESLTILRGKYHLMSTSDNIFAYTREYQHEKILVVANLSGMFVEEAFEGVTSDRIKVIVKNQALVWAQSGTLCLAPYTAFAAYVKA